LTIEQILKWADAHRQRTGLWPQSESGAVVDAPGESWPALNDTLRRGARGLPGGSSLSKLLAEQRGVKYQPILPPLTREMILAWADAHHQRTGSWPKINAATVVDRPSETWLNINQALRMGFRGLPGNDSLPKMLAVERGVKNSANLPALLKSQILAWADEHFNRTGEWPKIGSGRVIGATHELWCNIDNALRIGLRGLPEGSSLPRLLAEERGTRYHLASPRLKIDLILDWAAAHKKREGRWPKQKSGPVIAAPGETWSGIDAALSNGNRGLRGGSSLAKLLAQRFGVRHYGELPPLTKKQILKWADEYKNRTGEWPKTKSGPIRDAPGETWSGINQALRKGHRGLPGRSSLARLTQRFFST
jgi:hypothetical protein